MSTLLEYVAWNSLVAVCLAVVVVLVGRVWRRPELLHLLWLIVLVKLVTPGVVRWAALPDVLGVPAAPVVSPMAAAPQLDERLAAIPVAAEAANRGWTEVFAAFWIGGTAWFLILVVGRCIRFARAMRAAVPAGRDLRGRVARLAERLGVAHPRTLLLDATVPPMVWGGFRGSTLVLPKALLNQLDGVETDTLMTHELAHVKRRDPWVRWVELGVIGALWWNPLVWWVLKRLRHAEEQACDRRVLELFPHAHRAYADSIVKTVEFLAGNARTPQFATGAVGTRHIKERLIMILNPSSGRRFRHPLVPALLLAVLVLPVVPGFAERDADDSDKERARTELIALQREALELEQRLHQIKVEQEHLRLRLGETRGRAGAVEVRRQIEELERQGKHAEAAEVEAKLAQIEMERAREFAQQAELMDHERRMRDAELEMRETMIDYERARAEQDLSAAEFYERALAEHKRSLIEEKTAYEADELAQVMDKLRAELIEREFRREKAGAHRDQVLVQLEEMRLFLEQTDDVEARREVQRKIEILTKKLHELERRHESGAR